VQVMLKYLIRRLLTLVPVLLGVTFITFILMDLAPGDPAEILLTRRDIEVTPENLQLAREALGVDGPLPLRYANWLLDVLQGNLGTSFTTGEPVSAEILGRLPATAELAAGGLLVMFLLAFPLGTVAALLRGTVGDHIGRLTALVGASIPSFYLGLLLITYIAVPMEGIPVMGKDEGLISLLLPSVTLGFGLAATYARLLRANLLEVLQLDYIRSARSRGLREAVIIGRHAFRNALIPVVTLLGITMGHLLGGTVVVERIFAWPGVGRLAVEAIFDRNYPVIQGYVLLMGLAFVCMNLVIDLSYRLLDPRVRMEEGEGKVS